MKIQINISLFPLITSPKSEIITLSQFIDSIRSPAFQGAVSTYRRLVAEGRKKEADRVKRGLPAACIAATCEGGHSLACLRELSGLASLDFDGTGSQTDALFARLCELPYVVACFRTVSGQGVKAIVCIEATSVEEYRTAYARLAAEVSGLVGHAVDKQCKDATRLCFVSNDPLAFYRPEATVFPWRERAAEAATLDVLADAVGVAATGSSAVPVAPSAEEAPVTPPWEEAVPSFGPTQVEAFLLEFLQWNPFVRGHRHERMLKLGRKAASKNFSSEEFEILIQIACRELAQPDYDGTKMRQDILAGYQYVESRKECSEVPGPTKRPMDDGDEDYKRVDLLENNQAIQSALPYFPEHVYQRLPDLLKRSVSPIKAARERDFLLMSVLANLSACLPRVSFRYDNLDYSCHLFFAAVASTASGKGVVAHASGISFPLHQFLCEKSAKVHKEYQNALRQYQIEMQKAAKAGKEFTLEEPVEPTRLMLQISANCSKSCLVRSLGDNAEQGLVLNASEINTLVSSLGQDYGRMDDLFCAATHHEEYGRSFVKDGLTYWIEKVRLAFSMSGTLKQYLDLVRSPENGFSSRIAALTAQAQCSFRSCEPQEGVEDLHTFLRRLGEEVLVMYLKLVEMPRTQIHFTHEQWERHAAHFHNHLLAVRFGGQEDVTAVVYRFALLAMRLAAIFTTLRKWEDQIFAVDRTCTDEDFESALAMTDVLLAHTLQLSTLFPPASGKKLEPYDRILNAIREMSDEFTFTEFNRFMSHQDHSKSTSCRWLTRAVEFEFIEKQGDKYVKKQRKS